MEQGERGESETKLNKFALACAIVASMISVIFGYDTGVMSGAQLFIQEDLHISDAQVEVLAGILNFCALIGSLAAGRTSDYIGRRYTIVLASLIFFVGSAFMGYGPNYPVLMTGRCIAGIGVGFALMIAPVYSAEISSASHRGFLTSLPELCISIGILLGYVSNYFFGKLTLRLGWRLMLGVAAVPSLALAIGLLKMPESPRWLVMRGRLADALKVLRLVANSTEEARSRFESIKSAVGIPQSCSDPVIDPPKPPHGGGERALWKELFLKPSPTVRWIFLAAVGVHFFEHAMGIEAVILYSPRILKKAGIVDKDKLLLFTVGIGLTKTVFILFATFLIDKVGRRPLMLISTGGVMLSLTALGFGLTMAEHSAVRLAWALDLSIAATYIYIVFYSIGVSPLTWVYTSEIWPLRLRALGAGIGVAVNRLMNAVVSMSFISIYKAITIGGAFFMFAGISVLGWLFFYFLMPETRGKPLEEIEMLFDKRRKRPEVEIQTMNDHNRVAA
ncbi:Dolichyl-phosphate-mannose--protein mannosyltransferase 6 [Ancistrocladus abbreviatus]